ncbi:MAG: hypothetical protein K0Q95_149 [Bacteroidota bacterium]|jgi:hypothetical protein|nr:hypothetical protein [Bacteroidota bacterium]
MRKSKLKVLSILCFSLFIVTQSSAQKSAVDYMESINKELGAIMADTWDYTSAVAHGKTARKIDNKRKELIKTSVQAKNKIGRMPAFEGDASLRDSVVAFLDINNKVLTQDYEKIVNMEEIAEQSYDQMEAYLLAQEKANERLNAAGDRMEGEQRKFAAKNNINLLENKDKIAKKLESAGDVIKYYNELYLIFFKSYKQEAYLIDAQNRSDLNAMEQNKNALLTNATEGLAKLENIKPFKGDANLKAACKNMLEFYKDEASTKMPVIVNFYMKKEKLEKVKAAFDAKPQNKRTQQDVEQYNAAVNDMNADLNKYNSNNETLNKNRNASVEKWNNAAAKFMDSHVPKYK